VLAMVLCFMLVMAGWAGIFGLSQEGARGVLIHEPPAQVEGYYLDYSIGNAAVHVFSNGTVRADIILRNVMESPSPLEERIFHSFDGRPDWDRYVARSRTMLMTMFGMERPAADNLTFSTSLAEIRANGTVDPQGRKCTAYIGIAAGTRQAHVSPGVQTPQPGMGIVRGDYSVSFTDPWKNQGGFLDMVTVSWDPDMVLVELVAWSALDPSFIGAESGENTYVWENFDAEGSPTDYRIILDS